MQIYDIDQIHIVDIAITLERKKTLSCCYLSCLVTCIFCVSNSGPPNFRSINLGLGLVYVQFRVGVGLRPSLIDRTLSGPEFDVCTDPFLGQ